MNSPSTTPMHLAFCIDDNFCCHLAALMVSLKNHNSQHIVAHVVSNGLSAATEQRLRQLESPYFMLKFHQVNQNMFSALPISLRYGQRITSATYYRMALPQLLDISIDRVLYLDADMLVTGDLTPLWLTDLKGKSTAVVSDGALSKQSRWNVLGVEQPHYFNAGMMLMNLPIWREKDLAKRTFNFLSNDYDLDYNDQDLLNIALNKDIVYVDKRWNLQTFYFQQGTYSEPAIVHFTGVEKPWHVSSCHPYREAYRAARLASPYAEFEPELYLDKFDEALLDKVQAQVLPSSTIAIYGAGQRGRRLYHGIRKLIPSINIVSFIDKFTEGEYEGVPIEFEQPHKAIDYIILSSVAFKKAISQQLVGWQIPPGKIIKDEVHE